MKKNKPSETAEQMCVSRALETLRPDGQQVCQDVYAKDFLSLKYFILVQSTLMRRITLRTLEYFFKGHHNYIVSRTRYIDDLLINHLETIEQLVIIGAGYDSRAYRIVQQKTMPIYEVDYPATQERKKEKIRKIFKSLPGNVKYVSTDFNIENWKKELFDHGYNKKVKTFFIWEGVTPYLTAQAVDATLDFFSNNSASGSIIVFDYILQSVIDGTCEYSEAIKEFNFMAKTNEPLTFGLSKDVESFMSARGFCNIVDVGPDFFLNSYYSDKNIFIKPWCRIVNAMVQ